LELTLTREQTIDCYFEEMNLGPRLRLRESWGAVSPEDEARDATEKTAEADEKPTNLQKKSTDAAWSADRPREDFSNDEPAPGADRSGVSSVRPARAPFPSGNGGGVEFAGTQDPVRGDVASLDWTALEASIQSCRACGLCRQRRQAVPGVGDRQADWLFIGEGPGEEEDAKGEPFVGPAGKLLDNMLLAIGLQRGADVYIANAVKCRPPNNRTPEAGEIVTCKPYLDRQIALIEPKLIVVLGRAAAHSVLGSDETLGSLRGRLHRYGNIPVVVTYHPAYLLRTLHDKAKAWEDLCLARSTMRSLGGLTG